jgi:hypothetical protein
MTWQSVKYCIRCPFNFNALFHLSNQIKTDTPKFVHPIDLTVTAQQQRQQQQQQQQQ